MCGIKSYQHVNRTPHRTLPAPAQRGLVYADTRAQILIIFGTMFGIAMDVHVANGLRKLARIADLFKA